MPAKFLPRVVPFHFGVLQLQIFDFLEHRSKAFICVLGAVLIAVLGLINSYTGYELSFSFFYLVPVALVAWYGGKIPGVAAGVVSATVWQFANYKAGQTFSQPFIPFWNAGTRLGFFLVVAFLLTKLRSAILFERKLARTDFLTGAENPRSFYEIAKSELERARRYRRNLSITYLDCDNFKRINDTLGHQVGSDLLVKVVENIKRNMRSTDTIARLGGDEFAILLPETGEKEAHAVVEKIRAKLKEVMDSNGWSVTFSMGVLTCTEIPGSIDEMIKVADALMYDVKRSGKNSVKFERFDGAVSPDAAFNSQQLSPG